MWLQGFAGRTAELRNRSTKQTKNKTPARREGRLEALEDRYLLTGYMQMNLVSDQAGAALIQDPSLIAPWGITLAPDGNFWVADSGSSVATIYSGDVNGHALAKNSLTVEAPSWALRIRAEPKFRVGEATAARQPLPRASQRFVSQIKQPGGSCRAPANPSVKGTSRKRAAPYVER